MRSSRAYPVAHAVLALVASLLPSCASTVPMTDAALKLHAARSQALADRSAKGGACAESNLSVTIWDEGFSGGSQLTFYRVAGCGTDSVLECHVSSGRARRAGCSPAPVCIPEGCNSFDHEARARFVDSRSCPLDRVTSAPHAPPEPVPPPDDVAADAERLQIWKRNNGGPPSGAGLTFVTVSGCGHRQVYGCEPDRATYPSIAGGAIRGTRPTCYTHYFIGESR